MLNYRVRSKIHFWCKRVRRGTQVGFGTYFGGNKLGFFAQLSKFEFYLSEESSNSLGRLVCTAQGLSYLWRPSYVELTSSWGSFLICCNRSSLCSQIFHEERIGEGHCWYFDIFSSIYPYESWCFKHNRHHAKIYMLSEDTVLLPI